MNDHTPNEPKLHHHHRRRTTTIASWWILRYQIEDYRILRPVVWFAKAILRSVYFPSLSYLISMKHNLFSSPARSCESCSFVGSRYQRVPNLIVMDPAASFARSCEYLFCFGFFFLWKLTQSQCRLGWKHRCWLRRRKDLICGGGDYPPWPPIQHALPRAVFIQTVEVCNNKISGERKVK